MSAPNVPLSIDGRLFLAIYGGAHGAWSLPMEGFTLLGSGWVLVGLLPLLWWSRTRRLAATLAVAVAVQAALVGALKMLAGRVRPWIVFGLPPPPGAPRDGSFPSGHAAGSFCVAVFLAIALSAAWRAAAPYRARGLGVLALTLACLVALSRVYLGAHFPSDVLAGALLGSMVGGVAAFQYVRRRPTSS